MEYTKIFKLIKYFVKILVFTFFFNKKIEAKLERKKETKKRIVRFGDGEPQLAATPSISSYPVTHQQVISSVNLPPQVPHQANIVTNFQQTSNFDFSYFDGFSIHKICAGAQHYLILNDKNELFSIGKNNRGQLGTLEIPLEGQTRIPVKVQWTKSTSDESIVDISSKGWHNLILTSLGRVLVFGSNKYGQLGSSTHHNQYIDDVECVPLPTPILFKNASGIVSQGIPYLRRVKLICAGVNHTLIATHDGFLYSCGWAERGQLGHGAESSSSTETTIDNVTICTEIPLTRKAGIYNIAMISCGGEHSLILTDDSRLFILGNYQRSYVFTPTLVELEMSYRLTESFKKRRVSQPVISQISSGDFFALVLTKDGCVFSFGDNDKGQCAQPSYCNYIETPKQIAFFTPEMRAKSIVAGSSHAFVLTEDGKVYGFGRGEGDRLALFDGEQNHYEPQYLQHLVDFGTKKIAASGKSTVVCNSECELEYSWTAKSKSLKQFATKLQSMYQQSLYVDVEIY